METEDFLAWAVKVPVEVTVNVAFRCLLFASFILLQLLQQTCPGLLAASMERISIGLLSVERSDTPPYTAVQFNSRVDIKPPPPKKFPWPKFT